MAKAQEDAIGLIRRALVFRAKYREHPEKRQILVSILGVHPLNRSGVYPMEETVMNLGMTILGIGFSVDEANHEGVCVQEVPANEAKNVKLSAEGPYATYLAYNRRKQPQLRLSLRRSAKPIPLLMERCITAICYWFCAPCLREQNGPSKWTASTQP